MMSLSTEQYALTKAQLEDDWSEPSSEYEPDFIAMGNIIAEQVIRSLQPSIDAYEAALEPELALSQAALEAFEGIYTSQQLQEKINPNLIQKEALSMIST